MLLPRLALISVPITLAAWLAPPATSYACGGYPCAYDQFLPREGTVPANIAAIAWSPGFDVRASSGGTPTLPRFECAAADGSTHSISFVALPEDKPDHLQLNEKLIPGEHCIISSGVTDCSIDDAAYKAAAAAKNGVSFLSGRAELDVGDESPLPEHLGLIAVTGARLDALDVAADASCSENVEVCMVDTSIEWNNEALPWQNAFLFETFVDGEAFSTSRNLVVPDELGGLYFGRERDAVFATLGQVPNDVFLAKRLTSGEHSLQIKAHLPGSSETLSTPSVTIALSCGGNEQPPLAESNISGDSGGCTVANGVGRSQQQPIAVFGLVGLLLMAAKRRRR